MLPLIGITMSFDYDKNQAQLGKKYFHAVQLAGGLPVAIPPIQDETALKAMVEKLDGIILSGGPDIDPSYYNEKPSTKLGDVSPCRDTAEMFLADEMLRVKKPLLGICRGMQVLNVVLGGTLFQDIPTEFKQPLKHVQSAPRWHGSHEIEIVEEDSAIFQILRKKHLCVNSFHHQAVKEPAASCKVSALASDGVVEAIELREADMFCIGVQWHPEEMMGDAAFLRIFESMIDAAKRC